MLGDLNRDGHIDVAVGAPRDSEAAVHHGAVRGGDPGPRRRPGARRGDPAAQWGPEACCFPSCDWREDVVLLRFLRAPLGARVGSSVGTVGNCEGLSVGDPDG